MGNFVIRVLGAEVAFIARKKRKKDICGRPLVYTFCVHFDNDGVSRRREPQEPVHDGTASTNDHSLLRMLQPRASAPRSRDSVFSKKPVKYINNQ
jgi:hypothetical protein